MEEIDKELEELDLDEGIRIVDEEGNEILITRSMNEFCIMINNNWFYSNDVNKVMEIIRKNSKGKIKVWLY